jgi:hypothetical protein
LSISFGGKLDLNDNALVVDYSGASPLSTIANQIKLGYANGSWASGGITSAAAAANAAGAHPTAVGYAEASALGISSFAGQNDIANAVLVRCTFSGDSNLDGTVNALDFNVLATNFGGSGKPWFNADFNFDGAVTSTDFNALAMNFGMTVPSSTPSLATLVPEPSVAVAGALFVLLVMPRPRRQGVQY